MNKKGMLARDWYVMLIVFGTISGLGYLVIADIASESSGYNIENMTDENFKENYDTMTESADDIYLMQNATASGEGMSVISTFTTMFSATFSVISIIFGSFSLADDVLTNFGVDQGVPTAIANIIFPAILAIILGLIIFVIISSISKGKL